MKQAITLTLLFFSIFSISQEQEKTKGLFYKVSIATTLRVNENFTFSAFDEDRFFDFNAVFFNNTIGYQVSERSSVGLNFEYDWHSEYGLQFFPAYLSLRYNVADFDDKLFIRGGYGKLLNLGRRFESGTMYRVGLGYQIFDGDFRNSWLVGVDFTRKRFGFRQTEKLSSVSVFLEFQLF